MFITLDGVDGAGKTSVLKALIDRHPDWNMLRFPGQTSVGRLVRQVLLDPDTDMGVVASCLFFMADMRHTLDNLDGEGVNIADRGPDSTFVYQIQTSLNKSSFERSSLEQALKSLIPVPALTIILDVDYKTAQERMTVTEYGQPDRYEMVDESVWNRRRDAYENLLYTQTWRNMKMIHTHMYSFEKVVDKCESYILALLGEDQPYGA